MFSLDPVLYHVRGGGLGNIRLKALIFAGPFLPVLLTLATFLRTGQSRVVAADNIATVPVQTRLLASAVKPRAAKHGLEYAGSSRIRARAKIPSLPTKDDTMARATTFF